jgi:hypothetical protein
VTQVENVLFKLQIDIQEWARRRSENKEMQIDERKALALATLDAFARHLDKRHINGDAGGLLQFYNERYLYHRRALAEDRAIRKRQNTVITSVE